MAAGIRIIALASLIAALLPGAATAATPPTCQGRPATIVGHPSQYGSIEGTNGPDVIVTRGISAVYAGGGADLVCMTGTNKAHRQYVDAGTGDDSVVVKTSDDISTMLGKGDDVFRGGPGDDFIEAEAGITTGPGPGQVEGLDRITAGDGADQVVIGLPEATTSDVVDLGRGDDGLYVHGLPSPDVRPDGGAGSDFLRIDTELPDDSWVIDNASETATRNGALQSRWDSFQRFDLTWLDASAVTFLGSDKGEDVGAVGAVLQTADLGAGDDTMWLSGLPSDRVAEIAGGPGNDMFQAEEYPAVTIDLTSHAAWDDSGAADDPAIRLTDVEGAGGVADRVRLVGDDGDNVLDGFGCDVVATGGAGDDRVRSTFEPDTVSCTATEARVQFSGGPGDDALHGGRGPDTLIGGPGRDAADGDRGTDRCRAEVRRSCERR